MEAAPRCAVTIAFARVDERKRRKGHPLCAFTCKFRSSPYVCPHLRSAFRLLWTAAMLCVNPPFELHKLVIWSIGGMIGGLLWYWLMAMWMSRRGLWR